MMQESLLSAVYHDIITILHKNIHTHTPIKIDIMSSKRIESRLHYYLTTKIYVFTVYRRFPLWILPSIYHIITLLLTLNVYTTQGKSISLVRGFNQTNFLVLPRSIVWLNENYSFGREYNIYSLSCIFIRILIVID